MAYDPYRDAIEPGELPPDPVPGRSGRAIVWIVGVVALVLGVAILIGTRDASTPQASIQGQQTTGSSAQHR